MKKTISLLLAIILIVAIAVPLGTSASAAGSFAPAGTADIEAFVTRLYNLCLDRDPDAPGLTEWVRRLESGEWSGAQVAQGFIFSREMTEKNLDSSDYIEILYNAILGRLSEPAGKAAWLHRMQNEGYSLHDVFVGFAVSAEFRGICAGYGINVGDASRLKPLPMPGSQPDDKDSRDTGGSEFDKLAAEVLRLTNEQRAAHGLKALTADNALLTQAAVVRAGEIVKSFSHTRPDGRRCFTAYTEDLGGKWRTLGENIAMGYRTPEAAVAGWMSSTTGHREAILNRNYTQLGVGVAQDANGRYYWVQMFCG